MGKYNNKRPFNHHGRNKTDRPERKIDNLKEIDGGISEYIGKTAGFSGILKSKFTDFHVNEIDLDGKVTVLSVLTVPEVKEEEDTNLLVAGEDPKLVTESVIEKEIWERIEKLAKEKIKNENVEINVSDLSKETRTEIHKTIKAQFGQAIVSSTVDKDGQKLIRCSLFNKNVRTDVRTKWTWPHDYTYFLVHKINLDTMKAASELALNLSVKPTVLAYAGTKDKRAVTTQWFCIKKREPSKILKAAQRIPNLWVGNFTFKPETLKLGQLNGNRFRIAIRQVPNDQNLIEESLKSTSEKGFINYYGLQRFGNCAAIPTFLVGKALLKGNYKEACELIMKPREGDVYYMEKMRKYWWETRDSYGARNMLHKTNNGIEAKLLYGLVKHNENDYVNALENIPRNTRLLYIHAYQSLIWNKVASRRIKQGLELKVGDLVYSDKKAAFIEDPVDQLDETAEDAPEMEEDGSMQKVEETIDYKSLVRSLTEEDINSGKYSIFDVVLPLPGHDITYPGNETADWYKELLAEDDLSSEKLKQKNKTYSLAGAYRKMIERPGDMSWKFVKYNSENEFLINSDMELLQKKNLINLPNEGKFNAVILEMSLASSTYATMAIREILKTDTSTANQIKMSKNAENENVPEEKKMKLESENV